MPIITIPNILSCKTDGRKITMLTAYDFPFARIMDQLGIDIVLVGDSMANVVLGMKSTTEISMDEMISHAKAVRRAVKKALLVVDLPYEAYQANPKDALKNAKRFMEEIKCDALKIEWFHECVSVTEELLYAGIPVMGHVGLTPQTAEKLGGFKVQGKDAESAKAILKQAEDFASLGCFAVVLECVPAPLAELITKRLKVPTIGIGAGNSCDGQVLVIHDLLGLSEQYHPKFVKKYVDLSSPIKEAISQYKNDVESGIFPAEEYSYAMDQEEFKKLLQQLES